jgi:hypothetical protein
MCVSCLQLCPELEEDPLPKQIKMESWVSYESVSNHERIVDSVGDWTRDIATTPLGLLSLYIAAPMASITSFPHRTPSFHLPSSLRRNSVTQAEPTSPGALQEFTALVGALLRAEALSEMPLKYVTSSL